MTKKAFLFNGMGSDPRKDFDLFSVPMQERALDYLETIFNKFNLDTDISKNSYFDQEIAKSIFTSVCDKVVCESFIESGIIPDFGAGYSLGVISCSSCFEAFSFDVSCTTISKIKDILINLDNAKLATGMGVIIGLDADTVNELIDSSGERRNVSIGSVNSKILIMITGLKDSIDSVLKAADEVGAIKTLKLGVNIFFHTDALSPYCTEYANYISETKFTDPEYPIVSTIDQRIITKGSDLCNEIKSCAVSQMRWDLTIDKLEESGVTEFYDMSAQGYVKKFSKCKRKSIIYTYKDLL